MRFKIDSGLALALTIATPAIASDTIATLSVPGSALKMDGDFAGAPDAGGGFTIGVATSAVPLDASNCRAGTLSVDMNGARPGASGKFTSQQQAAIEHKLAAYAVLRNALRSKWPVTLNVRMDSKYLFNKNGRLIAPFCSITIEGVKAHNE